MKSLNLRIYRRTLENIALLWNAQSLTPSQLQNVEIFAMVDGGPKKLQFKTSSEMEGVLEAGVLAPDKTVVAVIEHVTNELDPHEDYKLKLVFGTGSEKFSQEILVYAFGVLPPFEKDDRKSNSHIYGYSEKERKWVKLPVVRCKDGTYAVPVVLKKDA